MIEPPAAFAQVKLQFTQEDDAAEWTSLQRDNFPQVSLKFMCSRGEAWEMILNKQSLNRRQEGEFLSPEDLAWGQEVLAGLHDPTQTSCPTRTATKTPARSMPLKDEVKATADRLIQAVGTKIRRNTIFRDKEREAGLVRD